MDSLHEERSAGRAAVARAVGAPHGSHPGSTSAGQVRPRSWRATRRGRGWRCEDPFSLPPPRECSCHTPSLLHSPVPSGFGARTPWQDTVGLAWGPLRDGLGSSGAVLEPSGVWVWFSRPSHGGVPGVTAVPTAPTMPEPRNHTLASGAPSRLSSCPVILLTRHLPVRWV